MVLRAVGQVCLYPRGACGTAPDTQFQRGVSSSVSVSEQIPIDSSGRPRRRFDTTTSVVLAVSALVLLLFTILAVSMASLWNTSSWTTTEPAWSIESEAPVDVVAVECTQVLDGDSAIFSYGDGTSVRVRMIGIDAPESETTSDQYTSASKAFARKMISEHTRLYLEMGVTDTDRLGQKLAYVWLVKPTEHPSEAEVRDNMLNAKMVLEGYANKFPEEPGVTYANDKYSALFAKYVEDARVQKRGFWDPSFVSAAGSSATWAAARPARAATPTVAPYVGNATSRKFHVVACENAKEMRTENRIALETQAEAGAEGFVPCGVCNP